MIEKPNIPPPPQQKSNTKPVIIFRHKRHLSRDEMDQLKEAVDALDLEGYYTIVVDNDIDVLSIDPDDLVSLKCVNDLKDLEI